MSLAYIVSMFPCWSETFILNELVNHRKAGVNVTIFSLKKCSESMVHEEAKTFLTQTTYASGFFNPLLWLSHLWLLLTSPMTYLKILFTLVLANFTDSSVKLKALAVFCLAPLFIATTKNNKITHLHAHFATYPALLAWIIQQFTGIPFTFTAHAHDIYYNQDILALIAADAAAMVTISEFNKRFICQKVGEQHGGKIHVIHCGIDLTRFTYDTERTFNQADDHPLSILSIGRLSGIKGFTYLIEALRLLKNDGVPFTCNIIGDGPLKPKLQQQVNESGLAEQINFLGSKKSDEIPAYLKKSDVFVLACATDKIEIHDGIPVVFMEAMAYGVPVIGTRLSGIPELIHHKETGLCAEPENPESICNEIEYFYFNQHHVESMRVKARSLVEQEYNIAYTSHYLRQLFDQPNQRHLWSVQKQDFCL